MKRLFLFTSFYPYSYQESFLEDEINYLSGEFDEVFIVPYCYDDSIRELPRNCKLLPSEKKYLKIRRCLFNAKTFFPFVSELFSQGIYHSKIKFLQWLKIYCHINNMLNSQRIKSILSMLTSDDVLYFYWGKGDNALSAFYKGEAKMVSRFHGQWDLWEEEYEGYSPLRQKILTHLNSAVTISTIGHDYLLKKYPQTKVDLFPLGTRDYGNCSDESDFDGIRILSCSTVYPLKRVDLIYRSLLKIKDIKMKWTHIGCGPQLEDLKLLIESESHENLDVELMGRMSHNEVMDFLKNHKFDVFVNLSILEGVPVSIMEAISFNIPVVATNVGGTPNVVNSSCGLLVSPNPTEDEVAIAINKVINGVFSPRNFWETHYAADVNYRRFAKYLRSL